MGGLPKSLERTICLALIQWAGITTALPVTLASDAGLPITSHRLRPAWVQAQTSSHTRTHLSNPTFSACAVREQDSEPLNLFHFCNFEG
jgi:hypothetical protein